MSEGGRGSRTTESSDTTCPVPPPDPDDHFALYVRGCYDCGKLDLGSAFGAAAARSAVVPNWSCPACGCPTARWLPVAEP